MAFSQALLLLDRGRRTIYSFLAGGSAFDDCDPNPVRLSAQVGGVDVDATTSFLAGSTDVTFRWRDAAGNLGTATSSVVVRLFGDLNLDGVVDPADLVIVRGYFNLVVTPGVPPWTAWLGGGDVNHDGTIDPADLVVLRSFVNMAVTCLAP